jgi:hypothetical protein
MRIPPENDDGFTVIVPINLQNVNKTCKKVPVAKLQQALVGYITYRRVPCPERGGRWIY